MLILEPARDSSVLLTALALVAKQVETARKATEALGLDTSQLVALDGRRESLGKLATDHMAQARWECPAGLLDVLVVGAALLIGKLEKVEKAQLDLGILQPEDTQQQLDAARSLAARVVRARERSDLSDQGHRLLDALQDRLATDPETRQSFLDGMAPGTSATFSGGGRTVTLVKDDDHA